MACLLLSELKATIPMSPELKTMIGREPVRDCDGEEHWLATTIESHAPAGDVWAPRRRNTTQLHTYRTVMSSRFMKQ